MSKMTGTAKSVLFASFCALFAASLPASAADNFLADRHKAKGLSCQMCHGQDMKNPQTPTIETCTTCHQKDALVKKTAKVKPTNPHVSPHYGQDLECTNCHMGHMKPENFCDQCHQFDFKVR